jgi:hypothetical protein
LARQDELQNGLLQGPEQADAAEFMDKCLTFTLEMESTMQYDIRTCMFIDLGASRATGSVSVKASVEIQRLQGGPWIGAMSWGSAQGHADCKLPAKGGGNIIECTIDVTGTGDPGVFTVNEFNVDLNDVNRPPPPPPPTPKPSVPATGSPTPVASPSGPPTPAPTEAPEYTITELRFRDLLVQPGDPQIVYDNNCQFFGIPGTTADHGSSHWLAGWTDNSQPVGRQFINQPPFGEAYRLANWELVMDGDVLARREYEGGVTGLVGTTHEKTTFVLRHTPRR